MKKIPISNLFILFLILNNSFAQVNTVNLENSISFTNIGKEQFYFRPLEDDKINDKESSKKLTLLKISHNGKFAVAESSRANGGNRGNSDNIARIIDLTDGSIIYEFPYITFTNYLFNSDDTKLFFFDDNLVKQLDLVNFEITNVFRLDTKSYNYQHMVIDNNTVHFVHNFYPEIIFHYSYNLLTKSLTIEKYNDIDNSFKRDFQKIFNFLSGDTNDKLLMLKLIYGNNIITKPVNSRSLNEHIIVYFGDDANFPSVFILKNGILSKENLLKIYEANESGVLFEVNLSQSFLGSRISWGMREFQLSNNNELILPTWDGLYVLPLISNNLLNTSFISPFKLENSNILFAHLNSLNNNLYYQIDSSEDKLDGLVFIKRLNGDLKSNINPNIQEVKKSLFEIDEMLNGVYNSSINAESKKNQLLESDNEKNIRLSNIFSSIKNNFIRTQDSLFSNLNSRIVSQIRDVKVPNDEIFNLKNYNVDKEYWRLVFENPFGGESFAYIYYQPKADAKSLIENNFTDISIEIKYVINLLSLQYEPLLLKISNYKTGNIEKQLLPYKNTSLWKNLSLVDNFYKSGSFSYISDTFKPDENIFRFFVSNGMPKYYFKYSRKDGIYNTINIVNMDDENDYSTSQLEFYYDCCPDYDINSGAVEGEYIRFNSGRTAILNSKYDSNRDINTLSYNLTNPSDFKINVKEPLIVSEPVFYPGLYNSILDFELADDSKLPYSNGFRGDWLYIIQRKSGDIIKKINVKALNDLEFDHEFWEEQRFKASFSPNGKYFVLKVKSRTYLFETNQWTNILNFISAEFYNTDNIYWDVNSYYLGIGDNIFPISLIDELSLTVANSKVKIIESPQSLTVANNGSIIVENREKTPTDDVPLSDNPTNIASLDIINLIANSRRGLSSDKDSRYFYRGTRKRKDEFVKKYNLDLISLNYLFLHEKDEFEDHILEFSFASDKSMDKFIEVMYSAPYYKDRYLYYYKDYKEFKVYYKYKKY